MNAVLPSEARGAVTDEDVRRFRRAAVVALVGAEWPVTRIAEALGVDRRTVHRWLRAEAEG